MATQHSFSLFTGLVQFVPTVERILYGEGVVESHLAAEIERLHGQRVLYSSFARTALANGTRARGAGSTVGGELYGAL